jgi:hypothetical protein
MRFLYCGVVSGSLFGVKSILRVSVSPNSDTNSFILLLKIGYLLNDSDSVVVLSSPR